MTLVRQFQQKTLDVMSKERTSPSFKKLDFKGEKKNRDGAAGGSFWWLLFCYILVERLEYI